MFLLLTYTRLREFLRGMADVRGEGESLIRTMPDKGGEGGLKIHHLAGQPLWMAPKVSIWGDRFLLGLYPLINKDSWATVLDMLFASGLARNQWWKSWWGGEATPSPTFTKNDEFSEILTWKRAKNSLFECKWRGLSEIWKFCRKFRRLWAPTGKSEFPPLPETEPQ